MAITQFDKPILRALRVDLDAALKAVADKHGISLRATNIKFEDHTCKITVEGATKTTDGKVVRKEAEDFKRYAGIYGLRPEDLGRTFTVDKTVYQIAGVKMRSSKRPILATAIGTGKSFVFPVETVTRHLHAA